MTDFVGREEFLRLVTRLDQIDAVGTRGVAVLAVQVQEIAKDFAKHEVKHDQEAAERQSGRRWLLAFAVALIAAIDGPVVTVLLATHGGH